MSDIAMDTNSEISTKPLSERKTFVNEMENDRDETVNGNVNEEMEMTKLKLLRPSFL
uniref:Uncharacterized protein n=1 Tax=Sarcophilus harrisii TaxID=9305 RepID=A0A7N4PH43_SARHA